MLIRASAFILDRVLVSQSQSGIDSFILGDMKAHSKGRVYLCRISPT